jgi:ABC-2 type transport system ATP-binding protein
VEAAIQAEGLSKRYKKHEALRGVSLTVPAGTLLGLLGPNGAGKTTMVRVLTTLIEADSGHATVAGCDVRTQPREVRRRIALTGQSTAVDDILTGRQNMVLLGRLLHLDRRAARARAAELLAQFDLTEAADRSVRTYSGGMRRRLDLAACLIARPAVLFLDEPTTGLDPASRATLWRLVRAQLAEGVTVLLTTQYLEEADQVADQIVVIDSGSVIAEGSPDELKRKTGEQYLEISLAVPAQLAAASAALARVCAGSLAANDRGDRMTLQIEDAMTSVADAAAALRAANIEVADLALRRPTLDDVFLSLVGAGAGEGVGA